MASPFVTGSELRRRMGMEAVRGSGHDAGTAGADAGADGAAAMSDRQTTSGASKQTLITPDKLLLVALVAVNLGFWVF